MKIIGKTEDGYLVEATDKEICYAAGYRYTTQMPNASKYGDTFRIGTVVNVTTAHVFIHDLRENETKCRAAAALLCGMAQMIEGAMPTTIIPPKTGENDDT